VDWAAARVWRVIVTAHGVPCGAYWIPGPGRLTDPEAFTERLIQTGRERLAFEASLERFQRRLGIPNPRPAELSCSVVVCTHRRSAYLPGLLEAVARLDPAPAEVIIVDNDPGDRDCRADVEAAGARYVREDRRGLDNARNTGLRAARGDLVAFTDDDCIPSPRWLANLSEIFAERSVGAVTGPAFAYELTWPAQLRFEREGGFGRGALRRHRWDWTTLSPPDAAKAGAGANMVFRREALERLEVAFPPELDAGTPTESGGDLYALYKTLAGGWRVVYDPGTYVFHRHRSDPEALHRAFYGYGAGLSATLTKVLVEDREPDAVHAWWWLVRQYRAAQRERLRGRADGIHVRVAWNYLRGGLHGPRALLRAKVAATDTYRADDPSLEHNGRPERRMRDAVRRAGPTGSPVLTVIVPTIGQHGALARCLRALAAQDVDAPFDIVVVDDARTPQPASAVPASVAATVIRTGGRGAAAARNAGARAAAGDVLLFLDEDLVPARDLVARHLARHDGDAERVVLGRCPPRPPARSLTDLASALWWEDRYRDMERSASLTFTDVLSGNMSIRRVPFLALGGFDEALGLRRREDWHWGVKVLQAGMTVEFEPAAVALHEFVLTAARRLAAALAEGRGDALLLEKHPEFVHALARVDSTRPWRTKRTALALALRADRSRRAVIAILETLERLRMRRAWFRLFQAAQTCEYARGRAPSVGRAPAASGGPVAVVDPDSDSPIPRPRVCAPRVRLGAERETVEVIPHHGRWNAGVAEALAVAAQERRRRFGPPSSRVPRAKPITVLVGPAHGRAARENLVALAHLGVEVRCGEGPPGLHWAVLDRLIREATTEIVATAAPGTIVRSRWAAEVVETMDGDRLALAMGAPAGPGQPSSNPSFVSRFAALPRVPAIDRPFGYLALRRDHYLALGGFDPAVMRFGLFAPPLEFVERALDHGLVIVRRTLSGVGHRSGSRNPLRHAEWQRQRARGALLARGQWGTGADRLVDVARGAAPLTRRRGAVKSVGALSAYAYGVVEGLAASLDSRGGSAESVNR